jgi:hypothetical protein
VLSLLATTYVSCGENETLQYMKVGQVFRNLSGLI